MSRLLKYFIDKSYNKLTKRFQFDVLKTSYRLVKSNFGKTATEKLNILL